MTSCWLLWMTKSFQNGIYSLRKGFAQREANYFLQKLMILEYGGNSENGRVASPYFNPLYTGGFFHCYMLD